MVKMYLSLLARALITAALVFAAAPLVAPLAAKTGDSYSEEEMMSVYFETLGYFDDKEYSKVVANCIIIMRHSGNHVLVTEADRMMKASINEQTSLNTQDVAVNKLSGPRLGLIFITGDNYDYLKQEYEVTAPIFSFFGWQYERKFFPQATGYSGIMEFIPAIVGVEQEIVIPTISAIIGFRSSTGLEFGMGPNITPKDDDGNMKWQSSIVFGVGYTIKSGGLNIPFNVAVTSGNGGVRFSLTFGFNSLAPGEAVQ